MKLTKVQRSILFAVHDQFGIHVLDMPSHWQNSAALLYSYGLLMKTDDGIYVETVKGHEALVAAGLIVARPYAPMFED